MVIKSQSFFAYSRIGSYNHGESSYDFPFIVPVGSFIRNNDDLRFMDEECSIKNVNVRNREIKILETENFFIPMTTPFFLKRSKQTVNFIIDLKKEIGYEKLLYIPGVSDPYLIPHLFSLGVDAFDTINASVEGSHGVLYTMMGRLNNGMDHSPENAEFIHNIIFLIKNGVDSLTLMEMVERWNISSKGREILRILEESRGGDFEEVYPRTTGSVIAGGLESLERPDILRFNSYVTGDYKKSNDLETVLFLPCAARKPYSQSRSHQAIFEALGSLRKHINEVIVTSPITLVPRELEETYPPGFYDIPVTGNWFLEEKENIVNSIEMFIQNNQYKNVIFFLPEDMSFIKEKLNIDQNFIIWKKGESGEFDTLRETISEIVSRERDGQKRDFLKEKLVSIAQYQFGPWIKPFISGLRINRMFNQFMLVEGNKPYFVYNERLGKLTIHRNAAHIFVEQNRFLVEIDNFKPTANIYSMGVLNCTEDIRQEDEVVIHHGGEIRGTGISKMSHQIMLKTKKGIAVKVRN